MKKNLLEWIVFGVSLVLVLFTAGYLAYTAYTIKETPPSFVVALGEPAVDTGGTEQRYQVPFTIRNQGNQSAGDVFLQVKLVVNEEEVETSEVTILLVPYQSERRGVLIFHQDPGEGELVAEIKSFVQP